MFKNLRGERNFDSVAEKTAIGGVNAEGPEFVKTYCWAIYVTYYRQLTIGRDSIRKKIGLTS